LIGFERFERFEGFEGFEGFDVPINRDVEYSI